MGKLHFSEPIFTPNENGLSFNKILDTLLAMGNYRPMPETSIIHFILYPADTLYLLTENRDTTVSQFLDFGKKWRADSVEVCDEKNEEYGWQLKNRFIARLEVTLWGDSPQQAQDVIVISWWD